MVERVNPALAISQQCRLLAVSRSSVYRKPAEVGAEDLAIMARIDRQYLARPYYGSRRMTAWLATQGHRVNRKRVRRLMRLLGLAAIYQRPTRASRRQRTRYTRTCSAGWRSSGSIRSGAPTSLTSRWPRAFSTW
jgi:putative transposase